MLHSALAIMQQTCMLLQHDAAPLVSPALLEALLGPQRSMPARVQRSALAMLYSVRSCAANMPGSVGLLCGRFCCMGPAW